MYVFDLKEHGEAITFFGEPDSSAPHIDFECTIAPGKDGPDPHIHPQQTETFQVTGGLMRAVVNGEERVLKAGETIVIEPGQVHSFSNASREEPLNLKIRMEPALNFQWFMMEAAASAIRNGGRWKDAPLLEICYIMNQVVDEHDIPRLPGPVKRVFVGMMARLAVLLKRTDKINPLHIQK
jgi:mannose-6-phosphate isomerase-like protein (cupin superfamily)